MKVQKVNANNLNPMEMNNASAMMGMMNLIQKIGKGKKNIMREGLEGDKTQNSKITPKMIIQALQPLATKEEIKQYFQSLFKAGDKFDTVDDYVEDFKNYIAEL